MGKGELKDSAIFEVFGDWCDEQTKKACWYLDREISKVQEYALKTETYSELPLLVEREKKLQELKSRLLRCREQLTGGTYSYLYDFLYTIDLIWN